MPESYTRIILPILSLDIYPTIPIEESLLFFTLQNVKFGEIMDYAGSSVNIKTLQSPASVSKTVSVDNL
jgi:hypothetical protein